VSEAKKEGIYNLLLEQNITSFPLEERNNKVASEQIQKSKKKIVN
jgi:hypothetical protein